MKKFLSLLVLLFAVPALQANGFGRVGFNRSFVHVNTFSSYRVATAYAPVAFSYAVPYVVAVPVAVPVAFAQPVVAAVPCATAAVGIDAYAGGAGYGLAGAGGYGVGIGGYGVSGYSSAFVVGVRHTFFRTSFRGGFHRGFARAGFVGGRAGVTARALRVHARVRR